MRILFVIMITAFACFGAKDKNSIKMTVSNIDALYSPIGQKEDMCIVFHKGIDQNGNPKANRNPGDVIGVFPLKTCTDDDNEAGLQRLQFVFQVISVTPNQKDSLSSLRRKLQKMRVKQSTLSPKHRSDIDKKRQKFDESFGTIQLEKY